MNVWHSQLSQKQISITSPAIREAGQIHNQLKATHEVTKTNNMTEPDTRAKCNPPWRLKISEARRSAHGKHQSPKCSTNEWTSKTTVGRYYHPQHYHQQEVTWYLHHQWKRYIFLYIARTACQTLWFWWETGACVRGNHMFCVDTERLKVTSTLQSLVGEGCQSTYLEVHIYAISHWCPVSRRWSRKEAL